MKAGMQHVLGEALAAQLHHQRGQHQPLGLRARGKPAHESGA